MQSVSLDCLFYSAADIIAHSIEGYFTATKQPRFISRLAEATINTVIETTETLPPPPFRLRCPCRVFLGIADLLYAGCGYRPS